MNDWLWFSNKFQSNLLNGYSEIWLTVLNGQQLPFGMGGNGIDSAQFVYHVECRFYVHVKFHEFDTNHKARRILARMHGVFVAAMCESQQLKFHRVSSILLT